MSLMYDLLGIPRNLDDFLNVLDDKNIGSVDVYLRGEFKVNFAFLLGGRHPQRYITEYGIRGGKYSIKLASIRIDFPGKYSPYLELMFREHLIAKKKLTLGHAEMLESWGYKSTINGMQPDRMRQIIKFDEVRTDEFRRGLEDSIAL